MSSSRSEIPTIKDIVVSDEEESEEEEEEVLNLVPLNQDAHSQVN